MSGNFAVRASGAGAPGATLDDIEEHQKWVAEWSERVQSAAERGPVPLGRVSERAAALLGGDPQAPDNLFAGTPAGDGIERDAAVPQLRESGSPPPEFSPVPSLPGIRPIAFESTAARSSATRTSLWVSGIAGIILLPAIVGFLMMDVPVSRFWDGQASDHTFALASSSSYLIKHLPRQRNGLTPRLVARESRGMSGEPVRLGLTLAGSAEGGGVIIAGLLPGMSLSSGSPAGADTWQVPATELADTWVGPPMDFVGTVDLIAELQLDGATIGNRQPIRIEWIAASPTVAAQAPTTTSIFEAVSTEAQAATTMPVPEALPTAAQVPTTMLVPKAVAIPRQLDRDESKTEQPGERRQQQRAASKAAVPMREKRPVNASAARPAPDAQARPDQQQDAEPPSQPTQTRDDQGAGQISVDAPGILGFLLPRRRSEPITEDTNLIGPEQVSVAAVSGDKATQEKVDALSPAHMPNQCDYRGCAKDYRSFRASDCTYQPPHGGPRKTCEKGRQPTEVSQGAAQVQAQTRAQQCNLLVCARFYRSFDPSDCTFQPNSGGARKACDR